MAILLFSRVGTDSSCNYHSKFLICRSRMVETYCLSYLALFEPCDLLAAASSV